ncbi:hypothetical protein KO507_00885 [Gilvimarinus agarilyticus]|uniref:hypothetical protein n=1 Tax=unclassified Gilvimarinus TaxID=2642066 RepID=UPI001C08763A|nr:MULTISPECIES: hypothetical protein [unclassified Gilvimarinus]MBU2884312.1 hypothetical protein [Gilvimarinus agarilyticus]MDO6569451.1 hypothetical protein [Gilvimarinus sp. 2_MG-2023]MDO6747608.1 hypothetical protein [Gilvimarinus sp. 1_MG-2023]
MKTYGVLLAGLLLANGAIANEAEEDMSERLNLAAAKTTQAINFKTEEALNTAEELKVVDLEVTQTSDDLADKISAKLDQKFEQDMKRRLGL